MAIETYKECEIEFDSMFGYTWAHPNYDGPPDLDDFTSLVYCGYDPDLKEVYGQIDELIAELDVLEEEKKDAAEAIREDLYDDIRKGIE